MSTKRVLLITIIGVFLIAAAIGAMQLTTFLTRDGGAIMLPETPLIVNRPTDTQPDELSRIEINRETVQAVVSTLSRPEVYSRTVTIESFWQGGQAVFNIGVAVLYDKTSLHIVPPVGPDKRIIVTTDELFIWHTDDLEPFIGSPTSTGDATRTADEWNMLLTFENILNLNRNDIVDAGFVDLDGHMCIFVQYFSSQLGNTRRYYISLEYGLVIAVDIHDFSNFLIYSMTASPPQIGHTPANAFRLPDGSFLNH